MKRNIIYVMKEKLPILSKAENKLASWILEHPTAVIKMNVTQLAKEANSSPATIVRLCYSLGLNGFTDLKLHLSTQLPEIQENLHTDIIKNEDTDQIKKKLKFNLSTSFEETYHLLDNHAIEEAVSVIEERQHIFTFGIGASGLVAEDLHQKFTRIGKPIFFFKDTHLLATALVSQDQPAVLIAISNSGEKNEVNYLCELAKIHHIPIIAITSNPDSTTAQLSDIPLITASGSEAPIRSSATNSMMVQLYASDIIFSAYASKHYDDVVGKLNVSKQAVHTIH